MCLPVLNLYILWVWIWVWVWVSVIETIYMLLNLIPFEFYVLGITHSHTHTHTFCFTHLSFNSQNIVHDISVYSTILNWIGFYTLQCLIWYMFLNDGQVNIVLPNKHSSPEFWCIITSIVLLIVLVTWIVIEMFLFLTVSLLLSYIVSHLCVLKK